MNEWGTADVNDYVVAEEGLEVERRPRGRKIYIKIRTAT